MRTNRTANPRVPGSTSPRVKKDGTIRFTRRNTRVHKDVVGVLSPFRIFLERELREREVRVASRRAAATTVCLATLLLLLVCASVVWAAGDANNSACATSTELSPGFRSYLPDCRAFELVTPPYAGGQPVFGTGHEPPAISPDGNHVISVDFAGLAGAENEEENGFQYGAIYQLSRSSSGWTTESLDPPASQYPRRRYIAASADLQTTLWELIVPHAPGEELSFPEGVNATYAVRHVLPNGKAAFTVIGPVVSPEHEPVLSEDGSIAEFAMDGASADLSRLAVAVHAVNNALWPGDKTRSGAYSLYEYSGVGQAEPTLVGVSNAGALHGSPHINEDASLISECGTVLGSRIQGTMDGAMSTNGTLVYFTALHAVGPGDECSSPTVDEVYARVAGVQTVAVSEPALTPAREALCTGVCREAENETGGHHRSPALFEGGTSDGSKVFFSTAQPLLDTDTDTTADLYQAEVTSTGVQRLVQVTKGDGPTPGTGAKLMSVARVSADGSRVYYAAKGLLTAGANGLGEHAESGAVNLYVYSTANESTSFVANLMTAAEVEARENEIAEFKANEETAIEEERAAVQALLSDATTKTEEAATKSTEITAAQQAIAERATECQGLSGSAQEACEATLAEEEEHIAALTEQRARLEEEAAEDRSNANSAEERIAPHESDLRREVAKRLRNEALQATGLGPEDNQRPFETTLDGRYLMFVNARHLTGSEDTSTVGQIFEYDATSGVVVRVSIGQKSASYPLGFGDNGNVTSSALEPRIVPTPQFEFSAAPTLHASRLSLSEAGTVAFDSKAALTPGAILGRNNVYEYRAGNVYLISPGDEQIALSGLLNGGSRLLGTSQSGADIFSFTTSALVPQDVDTQASWYDAREGGGFPASSAPAPCIAESCQGPLSAAPTMLLPGSGNAAEGNASPPGTPAVKPAGKPKLTSAQKLARLLKACRAKRPKRTRIACEAAARRRYLAAARKEAHKRSTHKRKSTR
jgi:hypothetical protein